MATLWPLGNTTPCTVDQGRYQDSYTSAAYDGGGPRVRATPRLQPCRRQQGHVRPVTAMRGDWCAPERIGAVEVQRFACGS